MLERYAVRKPGKKERKSMGEMLQALFLEGEPKKKRRKERPSKDHNSSPLVRIFDPGSVFNCKPKSRSGERIEHCLMIASDLRSVLYTGYASDLPQGESEVAFSDVRDGKALEKGRRLDRELFERIRDRVEASKSIPISEVQRETIAERWKRIEDFAIVEGFCKQC